MLSWRYFSSMRGRDWSAGAQTQSHRAAVLPEATPRGRLGPRTVTLPVRRGFSGGGNGKRVVRTIYAWNRCVFEQRYRWCVSCRILAVVSSLNESTAKHYDGLRGLKGVVVAVSTRFGLVKARGSCMVRWGKVQQNETQFFVVVVGLGCASIERIYWWHG
jgi:hypothetical protein